MEEVGEKGVYLVDRTSCALPKLEFEPEQAAVIWTAGQAALRTHDHPLRDDLEVAHASCRRGKGIAAQGCHPGDRWRRPGTGAGTRLARGADRRGRATEAGDARIPEAEMGSHRAPRGRVRLRLAARPVDFVGYCHLRNAVRVFLLERVQSLALTPAVKKKPDYRIPDDFDVRTWSRREPWDSRTRAARGARLLTRFPGQDRIAAPAPGRALEGARQRARRSGRRAELPVGSSARRWRGALRRRCSSRPTRGRWLATFSPDWRRGSAGRHREEAKARSAEGNERPRGAGPANAAPHPRRLEGRAGWHHPRLGLSRSPAPGAPGTSRSS